MSALRLQLRQQWHLEPAVHLAAAALHLLKVVAQWQRQWQQQGRYLAALVQRPHFHSSSSSSSNRL
jgi:hypothetical protein